MTPEGFLRAAPGALRDFAFLVLVGGLVVAASIWVGAAFVNDTIAFDFRGTLWDASIAIREGVSPYPSPIPAEVAVGNPALYPPLLMLVVLPLTFLPWSLGAAAWAITQGVAVVAALLILRVRDVRCIALALLSIPVLQGLIWGNATLLLVPLVALAWRWRDHAIRTGVVIGLALATKLFLWPLLIWLLGTRRYRAAAVAGLTGAAAVLVPWALIGFVGLASYPDLLRVAEEVYATHSYSTATILAGLGIDSSVAGLGSIAAGVLIAGIAFVAGRRGLDEVAISAALLGAILGTPIAWEYYYALLLVPLAIMWPRFSGVWIVAVVLSHAAHLMPIERLPQAAYLPGGSACCRPPDVPPEPWAVIHSPPVLWPSLAFASLAVFVTAVVGRRSMRASSA